MVHALQKNFGHEAFRGFQMEVIQQALGGQNTFVVMPTGGGKSLCYQLPALVLEDPVLVISPLIALMKDQVDALRAKGIAAQCINSSVEAKDRVRRLEQFKSGELKILYVTPERFRKTEFIEALSAMKIGLLAVDEAHCVSQWGQDFRPEYGRIGEIQKSLGSPPTMALTATATAEVVKDICQKLGVAPENVYQSSVARPNLKLQVLDIYGLESRLQSLFQILHLDRPAIVYCSLIQNLQKASAYLRQHGMEHGVYHGQLPDKLRKTAQNDFLNNRIKVILATPAFGLGVDKPDIRQVIHLELPGSLEAYYQEIGRAGRDGEPALCTLLYDQDDIATQMDFLKWSNPEAEFIGRVFELIRRHPEKLKADGMDYLRRELNFYNSRDFRVETAVGLLRSRDLLIDWEIQGEFDLEEWEPDLRRERFKKQNQKLLEMVNWVKTEGCRLQEIYRYFGEVHEESCGKCDNCVSAIS